MNCVNSRRLKKEAKIASKQIDLQIKKNVSFLRRSMKLLLFDDGKSASDTFAKQTKIIHKDGFSQQERESFKSVVYANTVQSMLAIVKAMEALDIAYENSDCAEDGKKILRIASQMDDYDLTTDIGDSLKALWADSGIKECFERSIEYQLNDSAGYYLDALERLCEPSYIPDEQDVLRTRVKTTGIVETKFEYQNLYFTLFDAGNLSSKQSKWIHCFSDVNVIIFFTDMSAYDHVLFEDKKTNQMQESLKLFKRICNYSFFSNTYVTLLLNNVDLFKEKITKSPLNICFPDYTDENDYESASRFVIEQFEKQTEHAYTRGFDYFSVKVTDTNSVRFVLENICFALPYKFCNCAFPF